MSETLLCRTLPVSFRWNQFIIGLLDFRGSVSRRGGSCGCCGWSWRGGCAGGFLLFALGSGVICVGLLALGFKDLRDFCWESADFLCPCTADCGETAFCGWCFEGDIGKRTRKERDDDQLLRPSSATFQQASTEFLSLFHCSYLLLASPKGPKSTAINVSADTNSAVVAKHWKC